MWRISYCFQVDFKQVLIRKSVNVNRPEIDISNDRVVRKIDVKIDKDYLLGLKDKPQGEFILQDRDILVKDKY